MVKINKRTRDILLVLLEAKGPITTEYIGAALNLSSRTIKRNLKDVENYLESYGYDLETVPGVGVYLRLSFEEKSDLIYSLTRTKLSRNYSKEERAFYIIIDLLKNRGPVKSYKYKAELGVSEGTISSDLDLVEDILGDYKLVLERQQGVGVFVEGRERDMRKLLVAIVYDLGYEKKILETLGQALDREERFSLTAEDKLLNMVDRKLIYQMESLVGAFEKDKALGFTDSQYVALIVHLSLVVERLRNGDSIDMDGDYFRELASKDEFQLALGLKALVEEEFSIEIPLEEVGYITMHLIGSRNYRELTSKEDFLIDNFTLVKLVKSLVKNISSLLDIRLLNDEDIIVNLSIHLETAIKRMYMEMDIRNPLIDEIRLKYGKIYGAVADSVYILEEEYGIVVPEGEIGYITMHIGASIEKLRRRRFKIAVVCPSGIGTSRLLAMKLESEFPNLRVVDTLSSMDLREEDLRTYDFLVSTVRLKIDSLSYIKVNPLLKEEDRLALKDFMARQSLRSRASEQESLEGILENNMEYERAIKSIMDRAFYREGLKLSSYDELLEEVLDSFNLSEKDRKLLRMDILKRESLGTMALEEQTGIIVHCRTRVLSELYFGFFKLEEGFYYKGMYIDKCILLLAPREARAQWMDTMSYLTQFIFQLKEFPDTRGDFFYRLEEGLKSFYREILDRSISKF